MRKIVQKELAVEVPVIVYVAPNGARAASAGVWISQAADVLAMAPETNIGSSTPINGSGSNIGSDLRRKIVNDAAASLRGAREEPRAQRRLGRQGRPRGVEPHRGRGAEDERDRHDRARPCRRCSTKVDGCDDRCRSGTSSCTPPAPRSTTSKPGFLTRFLDDAARPEPDLAALPRRESPGSAFEIFHPGVVLPGALGARLAARSRSSASRSCRSPGRASCSSCSASRCSSSTLHVVEPRRADGRRADRARLRPRDALPRLAGAVPDLGPARRHAHAS